MFAENEIDIEHTDQQSGWLARGETVQTAAKSMRRRRVTLRRSSEHTNIQLLATSAAHKKFRVGKYTAGSPSAHSVSRVSILSVLSPSLRASEQPPASSIREQSCSLSHLSTQGTPQCGINFPIMRNWIVRLSCRSNKILERIGHHKEKEDRAKQRVPKGQGPAKVRNDRAARRVCAVGGGVITRSAQEAPRREGPGGRQPTRLRVLEDDDWRKRQM